MSERIGEDNIREYVTAFADGELDAEQMLALFEYAAAHPDVVQLIRAQQQLRVAADRVVRKSTPPVPEALREQIAAFAEPPASAPSSFPARAQTLAPPRGTARRIGWWLPAAGRVAALVLLGVLVGRLSAPSHPKPDPHGPLVLKAEPPVPATIVAHATRIHSDCSRLREGLHTAAFPRELTGLAESLQKDLSHAEPYPDLSMIGYAYVGAGPCDDPLAGTVHLLYRTIQNPQHTVSILVQPFTGQFPLEVGKFYNLAGPQSPYPMYGWRTEKVVYFLLADETPVIEEVRQAMAAVPTS